MATSSLALTLLLGNGGSKGQYLLAVTTGFVTSSIQILIYAITTRPITSSIWRLIHSMLLLRTQLRRHPWRVVVRCTRSTVGCLDVFDAPA